MHLCKECDPRDWIGGPMTAERARLESQGMICAGECRGRFRTGHAFFKLCQPCAEKARRCQHCGKSTLSAEEQKAAEAAAVIDEQVERLIDEYTLVVKRFGISSRNAAVFRGRYGGAHEGILNDILAPGSLDPRMKRRPLLKYLYCERPTGDPIRLYCAGCEEAERPPAFSAARICGHFVLAHDQALCLHCALEKKRCSACDESLATPAIN